MQENLRRELRLHNHRDLVRLSRIIPILYFRRKARQFKEAINTLPTPLRVAFISAMFTFGLLVIMPLHPMALPASIGAGLSIGIWFA